MKSGVWRANEVLSSLHTDRYAEPFTHGSMRLGMYAPRGTDPQEPHDQDELYFVLSGTGTFAHRDQTTGFEVGDGLFVAAGETDRFVAFSDDFAAWVVSWGPAGGEND